MTVMRAVAACWLPPRRPDDLHSRSTCALSWSGCPDSNRDFLLPKHIPTIARRRLICDSPAIIIAGRGLASPYACPCWLPTWLPVISLAPLTFDGACFPNDHRSRWIQAPRRSLRYAWVLCTIDRRLRNARRTLWRALRRWPGCIGGGMLTGELVSGDRRRCCPRRVRLGWQQFCAVLRSKCLGLRDERRFGGLIMLGGVSVRVATGSPT